MVKCVRDQAAHWPNMNNGSRTSSIDSSTGEVEQFREPAADRHTPVFLPSFSSLASCTNVITLRFGLPNVICCVYCRHGVVSARHSYVQSSECMYTHYSCVCVSPCRCETTELHTIHTSYMSPLYVVSTFVFDVCLMCSWFLCLFFRSPSSAHPTSCSAQVTYTPVQGSLGGPGSFPQSSWRSRQERRNRGLPT